MRKISWVFAIATFLLTGPGQALPGQGQDKAQQRAEKARKVAEKENKFDKSKQKQRQQGEQNNLLQQAGLAVVIGSSGITVQQAQSLVRQYQVSGGRQLPPGIRKQLARGKPLPPGIAKKVTQPDLLASLPRHDGYEWQICGSDLVLVAVASAVIADVLFDVF
ncbi:MAG: hypothetical protein E6Q75_02595 [Rheinheimera sp.]|nr:MAG: hypothetical protein E6Q75_02595 [Rheinheimera sp.]